jgi:hypothetical protein
MKQKIKPTGLWCALLNSLHEHLAENFSNLNFKI